MSESWHPRKTEEDVAVARTGVAKYDRGWRYGAGTHEHDHSKPRKGGEVLKPEQILIDQFTTGYDYKIGFDKSGNLIAINSHGELEYGGPNSLNLSTPDDLAELLAKIINDDINQSIWLSGETSSGYVLRSQQTLTNPFALFGGGKNKVMINTDASLANDIIFSGTIDSAIITIDSVKFTGGSTVADQPAKFFDITSLQEVLIRNTEFKYCQGNGVGVKFTGTGHWNYITNSWFIGGAGPYFEGNGEMVFLGNYISNVDSQNTVSKMENYSNVIELGTVYREGANSIEYINCTPTSWELRDRPLIDSFNHQNTDRYVSADPITFDTTTVLEGSASLRATNTSFATQVNTRIPIKRGVKLRYPVYFDSTTSTNDIDLQLSTDQNVRVREGDGYGFVIEEDADRITIYRWDAGASTTLAQDTPTIPTGTWFIAEVTFDYGNIVFEIKNLDGTAITSGSISTNDQTYNDLYLQIMFANQDGAAWSYIDNITRKQIG